MTEKWYYRENKGVNITCPYCDEKYVPNEDTCINGKSVQCRIDGLEQEVVCDYCGKRFKMIPCLEWRYLTKTIDGECTRDEYLNNNW